MMAQSLLKPLLQKLYKAINAKQAKQGPFAIEVYHCVFRRPGYGFQLRLNHIYDGEM